ncbi:MAG: phospholipid carrier-dependent glycosyltransferase [Pirellulales bacterium]
MLDSLNSLLAFAMLALAAYGPGRLLARAMRCEDRDDVLATTIWSLALGLLAGGMLLTGLGLLGWLPRPAIGVATWCAGFWGLAEIVRDLSPDRPPPDVISRDREDMPDDRPPPWLLWTGWAAIVVVAFSSLVTALAPPTAGDALCYHLELPKVYLQQQSLVALPYSDNSTFPLLVEMLYLWGLALEGAVTAQLMAWGLGLLLALAGVLLATPLVGRGWAWLVAVVVLVVPGVSNQMSAPLNDAGLAMWLTLGLVAWRRAAQAEEHPRWYAAAGLMWGAALGTKYAALLFAVAVGFQLAFRLARASDRQQRRQLLRGAVLTGAIALAVSSVWYVRAAWQRGNPVYPFLSRQIGGDLAAASEPGLKTPLGFRPWNLAAAPWQITMRPERLGGRGHQLGPLFLMALGGVLFARRLRGLGSLLAAAGLYGLLWYGLRQNVRFLLPIVPPLAVAVVWTCMELRRLPALPRWIAAAALSAGVLLGVAAPLKRARDKWPVAAGKISREQFLARHEPTWSAACAANQLPAGSKILSQDLRAFYFQPAVVRENIFRRHTRYDQQVGDTTGLRRRLAGEGFTHLLLCDVQSDVPQDETLSRLVAEHPAAVRQITEYTADHIDGPRHYRLLELR